VVPVSAFVPDRRAAMRGRHRPGFYSLAAKCDKTKAFEIGSRRSTFTLFRYVRGAAYQGLSRHNGQSSLRDARRSARPGRRLATRSDAARCDMVWHGLARFGTVWHPKALLAGRFALSAVRFALAAWQRWRRVATLAARGNAGGGFLKTSVPCQRCQRATWWRCKVSRQALDGSRPDPAWPR